MKTNKQIECSILKLLNKTALKHDRKMKENHPKGSFSFKPQDFHKL